MRTAPVRFAVVDGTGQGHGVDAWNVFLVRVERHLYGTMSAQENEIYWGWGSSYLHSGGRWRGCVDLKNDQTRKTAAICTEDSASRTSDAESRMTKRTFTRP